MLFRSRSVQLFLSPFVFLLFLLLSPIITPLTKKPYRAALRGNVPVSPTGTLLKKILRSTAFMLAQGQARPTENMPAAPRTGALTIARFSVQNLPVLDETRKFSELP